MAEQVWEVPDGWRWSTLGEACQVNGRNPALRGMPNDLPVSFVPMAAVDAGLGSITTPQVRPLGEVKKGFTSFADGDVIYARITPSMENGKAAIAHGLENGLGFGSTEFHVLKPLAGVLPEWIFHFIRRQAYKNEAKANFSGTAGQLRVPDRFVRESPIPIAPITEQQRIVERIESLFAQSLTARGALDRMPAMLKRIRQAVLAAAFSGKLTERDPSDEPAAIILRARGQRPSSSRRVKSEPINPSNLPELPVSWCWTSAGEIIDMLQYGTSVKADSEAGSGIPVLRMGNIQEGQLDFGNLKYIDPAKDDIPKYLLANDDILINRTNSPELVGKAAIFEGQLACVFASYLIRLRANPATVLPHYLTLVINSEVGRRHIVKVKHQVAGQANINSQDIRQMPIPLAPLEEQQRVVAKIRGLFAQAETIELAVEAALRRAEKVDQAILARAFRGEL